MNETMGSILARLRREKGLTQEQLAGELGITYQAVSKWENELSSPDISSLPLLADIFGVSIDALFGRETIPPAEAAAPAQEAEPLSVSLPWPDDDTLHAVLFLGCRLVGHDGGALDSDRRPVTLRYEGSALNIESDFSVSVEGEVQGGVQAGGDVDCGDVEGNINCGGDVDCGNVEGNINCGGDVDCGDVSGSVQAGGDLDCGSVGGRAEADGDVDGPGRKKGFLFW